MPKPSIDEDRCQDMANAGAPGAAAAIAELDRRRSHGEDVEIVDVGGMWIIRPVRSADSSAKEVFL